MTRVGQQSECIKRQVGCVIAVDDRIVAEGWNSPPKKTPVSLCKRCNSSDYKSGKNLEQAICTHAEINAISSAAYLGYSIRNADLFCTLLPCSECMKAIISCGIKRVYYIQDYDSPYTHLFATNAGVELIKID